MTDTSQIITINLLIIILLQMKIEGECRNSVNERIIVLWLLYMKYLLVKYSPFLLISQSLCRIPHLYIRLAVLPVLSLLHLKYSSIQKSTSKDVNVHPPTPLISLSLSLSFERLKLLLSISQDFSLLSWESHFACVLCFRQNSEEKTYTKHNYNLE